MKKAVIAMHWIIRLGEALLLTLLLLGAGLYFALHTRSGMNWVAGQVREVSLGIVEIQSLSGLLPFRLKAQRILLHDFHHNHWLTIEEVTLNPSLAGLLDRELILKKLTAREVTWKMLPDFHRVHSSSGESKPISWPRWKIRLDELHIAHGTITTNIIGLEFAGPVRGKGFWNIGEVMVTAAVQAETTIDGKLPAGLEIDFALRDYTLHFPSVTLRHQSDTAWAAGAYHPHRAMVAITGRVEVVDLDNYRAWLGEGWHGGGRAEWTIQHPHRGDPWHFEARMDSTSFGFDDVEINHATWSGKYIWHVASGDKALAMEITSGPILAGRNTFRLEAPITYHQTNRTARLDAPAITLADIRLRLAATSDGEQLEARADISHPALRYGVIEAGARLAPNPRFLPVHLNLEHGLEGRIRLAGYPGEVLQKILHDPSEFGGDLTADLAIKNFPRNTALEGTLAWRDGEYRNIATGTLLDDIQFELRGEAQRLDIVQASATDGGSGRIAARGGIRFEQNWTPAWDIRLEATNASLFRLVRTELPLSGQIHTTGDHQRARIDGEVFLEKFRFVIPRRLPPNVQPLKVIEINHPDPARNTATQPAAAATAKPAKSRRPFDLNILMRTRDRFEVTGRGLQSEWGRGKLTLGGNTHEPTLTGSVDILRGYAMLLGRRFNLDEGNLVFSGPLPPQPQLNASASTRISDVIARLVIGGTTARPLIKLTSDPLLKEEEIMSMILFGKLSENMTPWQAVALANGLRLLSGADDDVVAVLDAGQNFLRIDQFDIKQDEEGAGLASVAVGKHIGPLLYVEGEKGFGGAEDVVKVTLELPKRFVLETESSPRIREGVSLFWRRDY